jgi:filamentous hemagglutinin
MDMFRAGRRDALGAEYEAAADEADRCTAQLSVMNDVLEWLEARKAMGEHVTLDQVSLRALETARAKAIYVNTLMTAFLVGHPSALGGRAPRAAAHGRGTREEARRAIIEPAKFRYLFGQAGGRAHNVARTAQNAGQLARIGVYDTAEGRAMLQAHFERVAADSSNIARTFSNEYGTFQVRESLFTGPGGHVKFESTWQVLEGGGLRLTAAIPFGGP